MSGLLQGVGHLNQVRKIETLGQLPGHGTLDAGGFTCTCDAGWGRQAYTTSARSSCSESTLGPSETGVETMAACQRKCTAQESCAHAVWKYPHCYLADQSCDFIDDGLATRYSKTPSGSCDSCSGAGEYSDEWSRCLCHEGFTGTQCQVRNACPSVDDAPCS